MADKTYSMDDFDPDALYSLRVSRPATTPDGFKYLPRHEIDARGIVIIQLIDQEGADIVRSAEPR